MTISRHDRVSYFAASLAGAIAAVLLVGPIVFHHGLPAYHHDWSLPFSAAAFRAAFVGHFSSWDASGVGSPNGFASANPVYAVISLLGFVFPPVVAGKVVIVLSVAASGITMAQCVRTMGLRPMACGLAAVGYVCSPALFNKLGAGHVGFWISYALFPVVVNTARGAALRDPRCMAALALAVGASVVQPQFSALDVIAATIVGLVFGGARGLIAGAIAFASATVMELPTIYSLQNAADTIVSQVPAPLASWETLQSASPVDAIQLNHYIIPYFETAIGYYGWLSLIPAVLALAGAVRAIRSREALLAIAFALVGFAIVTGTKGPFAALWSWGFLHLRSFSLMRELYNGSVLMAFAIALGLALLLNRQPFAIRAVLGIVIVCAFSMQLTGGLGRVLHDVTLPDDVMKTQIEISTLPPGRILPLPLITPLRLGDGTIGGIDAFAIAAADPNHPSATAYPTSFPLLQLAAASAMEDPHWKALARDANVVAVDRRPKLSTVDRLLVSKGAVGAIAPAPYGVQRSDGGRLIEIATRTAPGGPAFPENSSDVVTLSGEQGPLPNTSGTAKVVTPSADRLVDDPHAAWVDAQRWIALAPDWRAAAPGGVLTQSTRPLTIRLRAMVDPAVMMSASGEASIECGSRERIVTRTPIRWIPLGRCSSVVIQNRKGVTAVYRAASGVAAIPSGVFSPAVVDGVRRPFPWKVYARIHAAGSRPVIVVFSEQFSKGWELHGARVLWHGMANGFENAWEIEAPQGPVTFFYGPQRIVSALSIVSDGVYVLILGLFIAFMIPRGSRDGLRA